MEQNQEQEMKGIRMGTIFRAIFLSVVAFVLAVTSVSFSVHHMRLGFEREYGQIYINKMSIIAEHASMILDGAEFMNDPIEAGVKYSSIIELMIQQSDEYAYSSIDFGLYAYSDSTLYLLYESNSDQLYASTTPVSHWYTSNITVYDVQDEMRVTYFVPILDHQGQIRGLLEMNGRYDALDSYGISLESSLLGAVLFVVTIAFILFSFQYIVPFVFNIVRGQKTRGGEIDE